MNYTRGLKTYFGIVALYFLVTSLESIHFGLQLLAAISSGEAHVYGIDVTPLNTLALPLLGVIIGLLGLTIAWHPIRKVVQLFLILLCIFAIAVFFGGASELALLITPFLLFIAYDLWRRTRRYSQVVEQG